MSRLGPLLAVPGVEFVSLQKGAEPPAGVWDAMPGVKDFADTAAIVMSLEQVVSVDTAPAHLAAALGKPVLLLDRYDNCWRWLTGRSDSPWYPGRMQIIRQPAPGDWESVLRAAAAPTGFGLISAGGFRRCRGAVGRRRRGPPGSNTGSFPARRRWWRAGGAFPPGLGPGQVCLRRSRAP